MTFDGENPLDISFKIVNVVATATLDQPIGLEILPELFPHMVIYEPTAYPPPAPAYFKSENMEGKVSIFPSGKMISVGTRSEKKARQELFLVAKKLESAKIARIKTVPKIENIVATANLGFTPNLESISIATEALYEPEQFPGAIIRLSVPKNGIKATILLFASGKMVCVGLKKSEHLYIISQELLHKITQL